MTGIFFILLGTCLPKMLILTFIFQEQFLEHQGFKGITKFLDITKDLNVLLNFWIHKGAFISFFKISIAFQQVTDILEPKISKRLPFSMQNDQTLIISIL